MELVPHRAYHVNLWLRVGRLSIELTEYWIEPPHGVNGSIIHALLPLKKIMYGNLEVSVVAQ